MSFQATSHVIENTHQENHTHRLVFLIIAHHADMNGENSWPGLRTIAREACICLETARRAIEALEESGALIVHHGTGYRGTNVYEIPMPRIEPQPNPNGREKEGLSLF